MTLISKSTKRPKRQPSRVYSAKTKEELIHSQPGFSILATNEKVKAKLDLDAMGAAAAQRPKTANQSKVAMLEEEINRLGMLLKAEQHAHGQTKINAQLELDRYRQQLDEEKDLAVKGVIDEYMRLNLGNGGHSSKSKVSEQKLYLNDASIWCQFNSALVLFMFDYSIKLRTTRSNESRANGPKP